MEAGYPKKAVCKRDSFFRQAVLGCQNQDISTVPEHLIGIWKSTDARYATCYVEFSKKFVTFGTDNQSVRTHDIRKINSTPLQDNRIVYTFHYRDNEREKWQLIVTYNAHPEPTIRLKNLQGVWVLSNSEDVESEDACEEEHFSFTEAYKAV